MAENQIDYVTIADANFGVFTDRDMEVTEKLVDLQNQYGYPKVVDATWYKNSSDEILEIVKKFISSGFNRGLTLSVQSMDMNVLEEIKRRNILKNVFERGNQLNEGLIKISEKFPKIINGIRGLGLIQGLVINDAYTDAKTITLKAFDKGLLIVPAGGNVVRFVPPLIISRNEINILLKKLDLIFEEL